MVYRDDTQLLEIYEAARETLFHFASEEPFSFSCPSNRKLTKEHIQGKLDYRRASLQGWKKPTPKDLEEISSLEEELVSLKEELAMVDPNEKVNNALNDIGFFYGHLLSGDGRVSYYAKDLGDKMGILADHDIVSGEHTPCFYQVNSANFDRFAEWVRTRELPKPKSGYGSAFIGGGILGGITGGGIAGMMTYALVTGDFSALPITLTTGAGYLGLVIYSLKKKRENYAAEKAKFDSYPQERRDYFESIQLASGIDALTLATTPPRGVEERVQMRVEDDEVELKAEPDEPNRQQRVATVLPFKIPE